MNIKVVMERIVLPGESRSYWEYHSPDKWFKQAKDCDKINIQMATILFDSGAEVSIVDATLARKVGCAIDETQMHEFIGIGESSYKTKGRTKK